MKTNQLIRPLIVSVLWLCMGVGCRKEPPTPTVAVEGKSCDDGSCCSPENRRYIYWTYLNGVEADLVGDSNGNASGVYFKTPQPPNDKYPVRLLQICTLSLSNITGSLPSAKKGGPYPYKYRVWGKLYYEPDWETLTATAISDLYIDRIEVIN